ncbi:Hypothetical protein ORPV_180 [Orpheovirus IHUMI-LCC2]|uniref:Uncharacterized protein n=1 Tax=Orpheovirus IHUMI-LCC2 TaxID=2023057 RepID=A0A2I2L3H7_9VIRU|nr:Hypothetical protein ORPV_180 [Orpheovirus IHUMI-LCC2]SNW62084.1 Hypothetical protein ORPV_180 [Orpheovirus IHUMI-LCC2]
MKFDILLGAAFCYLKFKKSNKFGGALVEMMFVVKKDMQFPMYRYLLSMKNNEERRISLENGIKMGQILTQDNTLDAYHYIHNNENLKQSSIMPCNQIENEDI